MAVTLAADAPRHSALSPVVRRAIAGAVAVGLLSGAMMAPLAGYDPLTFGVNVGVAVSVAVAGVVLAGDPDQRTTGRLLVLVGALWALSWVNEWRSGPLPFLSEVIGPGWYVAGAAALLRYPQRTMSRRTATTYVVALGVWGCGGSTVCAVTGRPEWEGLPSDVFWIGWDLGEKAHGLVSAVWFSGLGLLLMVLLVMLAVKLRRAHGLGRVEALPAVVTTASVTLTGIVFAVVHLVPLPERTHELALVLIAVAVLTIPVSFVVTAVRTHMARAAVADLVLSLTEAPTASSVRGALRTALRDPSLELYFWLAAERRYVTEDNQPDPAPETHEGRWAIEIADAHGDPLAMLLTDPVLRRHRGLVSAAIGAGGLALSNGRLHQQVRCQLEEVRASRQRIVAATLRERRRIERDLHDGAQQSLLAVSATLSAARVHVDDQPAATAVIARAQEDLARALGDLRDLARGLHPAVLTDQGLGPALERVAEGLGIPTELDVPEARFDPEVESAIYFVGAEALTNIARHAHANRAWVSVTVADDAIRLRVEDDGRGGAQPGAGSGLRGLEDRLRALGGDLDVSDRAGGGTSVRAMLPCG